MKRIVLYITIIIIACFGLNAKSRVLVIKVNGAISPATASYIINGIEYATENNANAAIIELNTPGGLLNSTRDIITAILNSNIPIVVYISPSGSHAGSAGVFITLSANIAAMAPGTNIGSAHPVDASGAADTSVMFEKVTNDAAAFVRAIAKRRNKNVEWAEMAVRKSIASTETEALEKGVIDLICSNIPELLNAIHDRLIETNVGKFRLNTKDAELEIYEMNWKDKLLAIISDPNIAYILLMLGIYGLLFELYSPGAVFPGVLGGICIILGAYSMQLLPINIAGLALILLAVILFLLEIKVTSYGVLTIGGVISLLLGSIMLIDSPLEFMNISLSVIITIIIVSLIFFGFIITLGIRAQYRKKALGNEAIIGEKGFVISDITPEANGEVKILGEIWKAKSDTFIPKGKIVIVTKCEGLLLTVKENK